MNSYMLEDLTIGKTEEFKVNITEDKMTAFREMSGDINPMHTDESFAKNAGFKDRLVYGMLTSSFYSTLVGVYLPGKYCLFKKCEVEWPAPVFIGDELTVKGTVKEIDFSFNTIRLYAEIRNQNGEKVSRAKLTVQVKG